MRLRALLVTALVFVAPRAGAQPFLINTYTPGEQANPAIAAQADGGFVVVWESVDQDGDYIGVFGRRFAGDGTPRGDEFQVNQYVFGPQALPDVAAMANGAFVVVWQGYGAGGDYADIFARRYASSGAPVGSEFQVNVAMSAYEIELAAAVAATVDDGFTVVWDDFDDVHARRYDSAGAPRGGPFVINETTLGTQATAAVAGLPDGGFVVAWADGYYLGDGRDGFGYGVFGRRFDSGGSAVGSEFLINTSTLGDQYGPAIAATPDGGFVVVWQSYAQTDAESAIFARRYDSSGSALGSEQPISAASSDETGPPAVAADAESLLATWTSTPRGGGASSVLVRRFDSSGTPAGPAAPVDVLDGDQKEPAARSLAGGGYVVVWNAASAGDVSNVVGRLDSGTPAPTPTDTPVVASTATPSAATPTAPTATASPTVGEVATATATTAVLSPSPTATGMAIATATAAATSTHTAAPPACAGDCNGDDAVSVDELVLAVNIALGSRPAAACVAVDGNRDASVTVAELIAAVNRALGGCA